MAHTNAGWPTNIPAGSDALNTADDQLRRLRLDLKERFNDIVDDITADPIVIKSSLIPTASIAHVYEGAALSILTGVALTVNWFAETIDTGSFHDNDTNRSRLTITDAGYYQLYSSLDLTSGATADAVGLMEIRKNAASTVATVNMHHVGGNTTQTFRIGVIVLAAANDYYEIRFLQSSGDTWTMGSATDESFFEIIKLADV